MRMYRYLRAAALLVTPLVLGMSVTTARGHGDTEPAFVAVDPAVRVSFRVTWDGTLIRGRLVARSAHGFQLRPDDGEPGELAWYEWSELEARTAYETYRRLIPRKDADAWFDLGVLMLECDARGYADRAFAVAKRLDAAMTDRVYQTIAAWEAGDSEGTDDAEVEDEAEEGETTDADAADDDAPPPLHSPASGVRVRDPWPVLSAEEQVAATEEVKASAARLLKSADFEIEPVETKHFLLYSDLNRSETKRWSGEVERMYVRLVRALDMPLDVDLFHGKCVIFIFADRSDFIHFEALGMNWDASGAAGVFHGKGSHAYVSFFKSDTDAQFASTLVHETVHAFMYRYRSPVSLPTWANEGLADFTAGELIRASGEPRSHWYHVKNFVNQGGDALKIMSQSVHDGTWYDDDSYPVSHMLVRFMLRFKPKAFKMWIDDIKDGEAWDDALELRFNVTAEELAEQFGAFMEGEREFVR